jgi:hypothetical protein
VDKEHVTGLDKVRDMDKGKFNKVPTLDLRLHLEEAMVVLLTADSRSTYDITGVLERG